MNKDVLVIGAGRSGRGYIGELLHFDGWNVVFADKDKNLCKRLKEAGQYHVYKFDGIKNKEIVLVNNFRVINTVDDHENYIKTIANSYLVMTALFPDAFECVSKDIAETVKLKISMNDERQLVVLLGANYVGLKDRYYELVLNELNEEEKAYFDKKVHLVESVITRISSMPTPEQASVDPLSIQGENQNILAVNSELKKYYDDSLLPKFFVYEDDTEKHFKTKIWQGNTLHCSLAFMGSYYGYTYIYEAANDKYISYCAEKAYREANAALAKIYDDVVKAKDKIAFLEELRDDSVKDWIKRVGNDPIRKLSKNDRLIGPALLATKFGMPYDYITKCAAYGFMFHEEISSDKERIVDLVKREGISKAIMIVCGLDPNGTKEEKLVHAKILNSYEEINKKEKYNGKKNL